MTHWWRSAASACLLAIVLVSVSCSASDSPTTMIPGTTTGQGLEIEFRGQSERPASGESAIEVTVRRDGLPVTDATVTAAFSMPAMPSMNMPEMRTETTLAHEADGHYRGTAKLSMAGNWNVVVKVSRGADELGSHRLNLVAK